MTKMDDFSIDQMMLFVVGVLGALGALCLTIQKSKCKSFCWGCIERDVDAIIAEERLQMTGHTGMSPIVKKEDKLKLELKEPEQENEN